MSDNLGDIFIFAEYRDNTIDEVVFELIGKGRELSNLLKCDVTAILIGYNIKNMVSELSSYGANHIIVVDEDGLDNYDLDRYANVLVSIVEEYNPKVFLFGGTDIGQELAPSVAARLKTGLTADCTRLDIKDGELIMTRPAYGGNVLASITSSESKPIMSTVRPNVMNKLDYNPNANVNVIEFNTNSFRGIPIRKIIDIVENMEDDTDISSAKILVSVGLGIESKDNIVLANELADTLGAKVSCSRGVVEKGWLDRSRQVGQTGRTVRPDLYIALGISGAIQHLAGMEDSKMIIAINKDDNAPIFQVADYGIIGDVAKLVPQLTREIQRTINESNN